MRKEEQNGYEPDANETTQMGFEWGQDIEPPTMTILGRVTRAPRRSSPPPPDAPDFEIEGITGDETVWERQPYQIILGGDVRSQLQTISLRRTDGVELEGWRESRVIETPNHEPLTINLFRVKSLKRRDDIPL